MNGAEACGPAPTVSDDGSGGVDAHLVTLVLDACARTPDAVALRVPRRTRRGRPQRFRALTFRELADRIEAVARGLRSRGLEPGGRVLFSIRPRLDGIVTALGIARAGGTVVFVDPGSTPELFAARVRAARPTHAATESLLHALSRGPLRAVARSRGLALPGYATLPVTHVHSGPWLPGVPRGSVPVARLRRGSAAPAASHRLAGDLPPPDPRAPMLVVFTSGTTAAPRAVVHSGATLAAATRTLGEIVDLTPGQDVVTDQMLLGVPALLAGATWTVPVVAPARDVVTAGRLLTGADVTFLVPSDVTGLLDAIEAGAVPARTASTVLVGGAPVTRALLTRATRLLPGTRWVGIYGMTECLPVASVEAPAKLAHAGDGDLVGTAVSTVAVRVVPDDAVPDGAVPDGAVPDGAVPDGAAPDGAVPDVAPGAVGELVVSGPALMLGLLGESGEVVPVAEHRTGDLARVDPDGTLVLLGRTRDMIIRGTVNIYPALFEPRLAALTGVGEAVLVGLPREDGDEEVALVVVPSNAGSRPDRLVCTHPLADAVRPLLADVLDHGALPDVVLVAPAVPVAGRSRKPDRAGLARAVAEHVAQARAGRVRRRGAGLEDPAGVASAEGEACACASR
ncbi:class I adenylate-forming enzyme family protein [Sanguibacter sp. HDW7]|uniref:class I adenylate-forming enzyme family protein n=1 Tax=Sanguibacter sp. HDW7 TaxID=2714931 RepID=UPI00140AC40E|nr:class I adenylate-forming enzyme family protein [Sanguibacter sp. HDW7]QIK83945.1 acyl--CoA ligase [Sanguibacter sp. HDW7]